MDGRTKALRGRRLRSPCVPGRVPGPFEEGEGHSEGAARFISSAAVGTAVLLSLPQRFPGLAPAC